MAKLVRPALPIVLAFVSATAAAQVTLISDFELSGQMVGTNVPTAAADAEGWTSLSGIQRYVGVACQLPLNGSSRYCEISPNTLGPAVPVVPPSTPGAFPFTGGVSQMSITSMVPVYPSLQASLRVDWYWATAEFASGSGVSANDFAQIVVLDPSATTVIATLLYVDTYAPNAVVGGNTCAAAVSGVVANNNVGPARTATVSIPATFVGLPLQIRVIAANQADNMFDSVLWIDNLAWFDPVSQFDLTAQTAGGGAGDLTLQVTGAPAASATHVQILVSGTAAAGGLGTGLFFGLVPDGLMLTFLQLPAQPNYPFHYPVAFSPFLTGPFSLPTGAASGLAGMTWDAVAFSYNLSAGILDVSSYRRLAW